MHDGVRPLIDEQTITACIDSVSQYGPTATVAPSLKRLSRKRMAWWSVSSTVRAANLRVLPKALSLMISFAEHLRARKEGRHDFIDSISLMAHYGHKASYS